MRHSDKYKIVYAAFCISILFHLLNLIPFQMLIVVVHLLLLRDFNFIDLWATNNGVRLGTYAYQWSHPSKPPFNVCLWRLNFRLRHTSSASHTERLQLVHGKVFLCFHEPDAWTTYNIYKLSAEKVYIVVIL